MREVVTLSITSFRMSIGGEHWYGRLDVRTRMEKVVHQDGSIGLVTRSGYGHETHPHDRHELKRRIGAREAAYLNRKDDGGMFTSSAGLRSGDETTRFNDVESIVAAAVETFPTLFDDADVLMYERKRHSGEYEILVAPDAVRTALEGIADQYDREDWLMANGYLVKDGTDTDRQEENGA